MTLAPIPSPSWPCPRFLISFSPPRALTCVPQPSPPARAPDSTTLSLNHNVARKQNTPQSQKQKQKKKCRVERESGKKKKKNPISLVKNVRNDFRERTKTVPSLPRSLRPPKLHKFWQRRGSGSGEPAQCGFSSRVRLSGAQSLDAPHPLPRVHPRVVQPNTKCVRAASYSPIGEEWYPVG